MSLNFIETCLNSIAKAKKFAHLNAFVTNTFDLALEQANAAHLREKNNATIGSNLDGRLFTLKDNFCTQSIRTTCGSKMLETFVPSYNATVVERLYNSGGVLLGKTNMDEFGMGSISSSYFGTVKNPHKLEQFKDDDFYISGGSSGGSAVTVALDLCDFSIGSDTGGSIRQPAALSGCIGFKPTYGLISRYGLIPLNNYFDTVGIISKSMQVLVDVLNTIAGPDLKDSTSTQKEFKPIRLDDSFNVARIKFGIPKEFYPNGLSETNLNAWNKSLELFSETGESKLEEVSIPNAPYSMSCYSVLTSCEVASNFARYDGLKYGYHSQIDLNKPEQYNLESVITKNRNDSLGRVVKGRIVCGNYFLLENNYDRYFLKSHYMKQLITNDFLKAFANVDILVTPTCFYDTPTYKEYLKSEQIFDEKDFFTACVNIAGLPAISVSVCLSDKGLPVGIQLISNRHNEHLLLNVANWFIKNNLNFNYNLNKTTT